MSTYTVYYDTGTTLREIRVRAISVEDAIAEAKRIRGERINAYQVDRYDTRLCSDVPVWTDPNYEF